MMERRVLITGGTGSVGRALVAEFAKLGYATAFQYGSQSDVAGNLALEFGAEAIQLDLATLALPPSSDYDIVVNNAAINISREVAHDTTDESWNKTVCINLTYPFALARHVLPSMMGKRWGRIINISSIYGLRGCERNLPYTVSKHGMSGLTKTVAKEYAQYGITSNEICPGPIESELLSRIARHYGKEPEAFNEEISAEIPAQRLAAPREIAQIAVFLASEQAGYLNGASIPVDGGWIA